MPQSRQRRRSGHGEVIPPLSVFDRVDSLLKEHLSIFPSKPELTEEEIEHWHSDLNNYPLEAIEYAFDCWRRNGRFFPVYADIMELCGAWKSTARPEKPVGCEKCEWSGFVPISPEPHSRVIHCECVLDKSLRTQNPATDPRNYGKGWGWNEVMILWKLYNAKFAELKRKLTHAEWESLYDEIDRMRGHSPAWR